MYTKSFGQMTKMATIWPYMVKKTFISLLLQNQEASMTLGILWQGPNVFCFLMHFNAGLWKYLMPDLSNLVPFHSGQVRNFYLFINSFQRRMILGSIVVFFLP